MAYTNNNGTVMETEVEEVQSVIVEDTKNEIMTAELNKLRSMSLRDINKYGVQIQERLNVESSDILRKKQMQDLGASKKSLDELNDITKYNKRMLPILKTPLRKLRHFQSNFAKVGDQLDEIKESITQKHDAIDEYIQDMVEQTQNLGKAIKDIRQHEDMLLEYTTELQQDESEDTKIRLREVSSRLQVLSGTRVTAEQAQIEAYLIIKTQQEAKHQLSQVIQNVIPILSMQAVNTLGIQSNKETLKIISRTRDIAGNVIERNAQEIKNMAVELQSNRTKSIIDTDKLMNAQKILNEAITIVSKASELEATTNINIAKELREQAKDNMKIIEQLSEST